MRYLVGFVVLFFYSVTMFAQVKTQEVPADYGYIVKIGQQVPDFSMKLTDGKTVRMNDLRGKVVMLQFTASWCGVCRKGNASYRIDLDEPLDKVVKFGKDVGITYPLALDPAGSIFYTFAEKGAGVTRNVIIDTDGKIVYMTRLYKEEEFREMVGVIDQLLAKAK